MVLPHKTEHVGCIGGIRGTPRLECIVPPSVGCTGTRNATHLFPIMAAQLYQFEQHSQYGMCMEDDTREAKLPHTNGNLGSRADILVRSTGTQGGGGTSDAVVVVKLRVVAEEPELRLNHHVRCEAGRWVGCHGGGAIRDDDLFIKLLYSGFETCFAPSTFAAGRKTHLESRFWRHFENKGVAVL